MSIATTAVRIKATLDDVEPEVMRRLVVPVGLRLDRLHLVLQAAFGWTNTHLYEFRAGGLGWGEPDPDGIYDGPIDARKARLYDVVKETGAKSIDYIYDFGDNWLHKLKLEKWFPDDPMVGLPYLLEAKGRCPPEDVGGAPGYEDYLAAIKNPDHPEHAHMIAWGPEAFDPLVINEPELSRAVDELAEIWERKPRRKKAGQPPI